MKVGIIAELLRLPLHEGIARAAQIGAQGVQLHALYGERNFLQFSRAQLGELKSVVHENGLVISAICGDLPGHGFSRAEENPAKIDTEKRILDLLPQLGCRVVTTHIGVVPPERSHPTYEPMVNALRELGDHAHAQGCVLAIETGPEQAPVLKRFIEDTGSKGVGVNLDPANLVMIFNDDPVQAVNILGKYIVHTHVKDGVHYQACDPFKVYGAFAEGGFEKLVAETGALFAEVTPGQGSVRWPEYLQALKDVGYDGFLTVEREVGAEPEKDIRAAIDFIRSELKQLS